MDTILNGVYQGLKRRKSHGTASTKGNIVGQTELNQHRKQFLLLQMLYPLFWVTARMDALLPLQSGYKLIVQARRPVEGRESGMRIVYITQRAFVRQRRDLCHT